MKRGTLTRAREDWPSFDQVVALDTLKKYQNKRDTH